MKKLLDSYILTCIYEDEVATPPRAKALRRAITLFRNLRTMLDYRKELAVTQMNGEDTAHYYCTNCCNLVHSGDIENVDDLPRYCKHCGQKLSFPAQEMHREDFIRKASVAHMAEVLVNSAIYRESVADDALHYNFKTGTVCSYSIALKDTIEWLNQNVPDSWKQLQSD